MHCKNCKFFDPLNDEFGWCHRYAPHPGIGGDVGTHWQWPGVSISDWCGEFKERYCSVGPEWPSPAEDEQEAADWRDHRETVGRPTGLQ